MLLTNQLKNQHLLWRAGFGPSIKNLTGLSTNTPLQVYQKLEQLSRQPVKTIAVANDESRRSMRDILQGMSTGGDKADQQKMKMQLLKKSRDQVKELNLSWMNEMVHSDNQLQEKMTLFWHGHFACRNLNMLNVQHLFNDIRTHALGSFGDLLTAISKSPAMLAFLNNQQNRKLQPNENFARELMELFTIGRGNYTEADVKDAARAFTGWGFNAAGEFVFRRLQHDDGMKTVLGTKGKLDGDDVIKILLQQKQTAVFISSKVYRYFVNDKVDEQRVQWLAQRFYKSGYNIAALMKDVFTSDWFYDEKNIGAIIKSPVELLVGLRRMLPSQMDGEQAQLLVQKALGQILFYPPNVAGWPGGKNWIDSSTLMFRLRLPQMLSSNQNIDIATKTDDDQQMGTMEPRREAIMKRLKERQQERAFKALPQIDWPTFGASFANVSNAKLHDALSALLLQSKLQAGEDTIKQLVQNSGREDVIKTTAIALMSMPEYQLR